MDLTKVKQFFLEQILPRFLQAFAYLQEFYKSLFLTNFAKVLVNFMKHYISKGPHFTI